jgi:hypothetical protein
MSTPTGRKQIFLDERDILLLKSALQALMNYASSGGGTQDTPPHKFTRECITLMRARIDALNGKETQ